jgi:glutaconyl-CoA/methylmalonyl-CoA decarboxylase subunit delta
MGNLGWGLQITAVGMGLVFGMLALLWGLLALVLRFDREPAVEASGAVPAGAGEPQDATADEDGIRVAELGAGNGAGDGTGVDPDLVAAIAVAVVTHRAVRRRQAAPAMRSYWPGSLLYASRWVGTGRARQNFYWRRRGR